MKPTLRHFIFKSSKANDKKRILKLAKENFIMHKRPLAEWTDFSSETRETRREWDDSFKGPKEKSVNQKFHIQQNCLSKMKKKWRDSQKAASVHQKDFPIRNTKRCTSDWNKTTLDRILKPYQDIKNSSKLYT